MSDKKSEVISSTAEINTGVQAVELKGRMVETLPDMTKTEKDYAISSIEKYLYNSGQPDHLMIMSKEHSYFTVLKNLTQRTPGGFAEQIFGFLDTDEYFKELGGLKLIDDSGSHLEVWAGSTFFAMFAFDDFIVEI